MFNLLFLTWLSDRLDERGFVSLIQPLWSLPCLIALRWWPGVLVNKWGTYGLLQVLLSFPYARTCLLFEDFSFSLIPFFYPPFWKMFRFMALEANMNAGKWLANNNLKQTLFSSAGLRGIQTMWALVLCLPPCIM